MKRSIVFITTLFLFLVSFFFCAHAEKQKIPVFFFYSSHCKACQDVKSTFLPTILARYEDKIKLEMLETSDPQNLGLLLSLSEQFNRTQALVPTVYIGESLLVGKNEVTEGLEGLIRRYTGRTFFLPLSLSPKKLIEQFKSISLFTLISAGLIDGINPCAFAVIVFFISFLSVYGYDRRQMVYIGTCYVVSVFITYVLIGLGLFHVFYAMKHFYILMKSFYYLVAAFCFVLALLAAHDYIKYKKSGDTGDMVLQLPKFLKKRINLVIGSRFRQHRYARIFELCFISLAAGHVVSLLEAACTGQVYLPTIAFILQVPYLRVKAFLYLLLYNFMFVLPLIAIFILSLVGFTSKQFTLFLRAHIGRIKIAMVLLFLSLGALMIWLI